ncbi:MAG: protein kinase [Coriobacteriales bacterium]|nr:protein kinase [Coriobacteriales bacterium]
MAEDTTLDPHAGKEIAANFNKDDKNANSVADAASKNDNAGDIDAMPHDSEVQLVHGDSKKLAQETIFDPHGELSSGGGFTEYDLPEELHGKYKLTGKPYSFGAEAATHSASKIADSRQVIIKVYKGSRHTNASVLQKLMQARSTNCKKYSSHLPEVIEFGKNYEVLEQLKGCTLRDAFSKQTITDIRKLIKAIGDSLEYLHSIGIVHRDIKPENLIYDNETGQIKIIDFGIALCETPDDTSGNRDGTLPYQDTEGYDDKLVKFEVDWWSVGIIALEHQLGRVPLSDIKLPIGATVADIQKARRAVCRSYRDGASNNELYNELATLENTDIKNLIRGLLSPHSYRWKNDDIIKWAKGEQVPLFDMYIASAFNADFDSNYAGDFSVNGYNHIIRTPEDLYELLAKNYPLCNKLFTDNKCKERFKVWAKGGFSGKRRAMILAQIDSGEHPDYRGLAIQALVLPAAVLHYKGVELSSKGLLNAIAEAQDQLRNTAYSKIMRSHGAIKWLEDVYKNAIFSSVEAFHGSSSDGTWLKIQNGISSFLSEADTLADELTFLNFKEYYKANRMNYLYVLYAAAISNEHNYEIYTDTRSRYDLVDTLVFHGEDKRLYDNFCNKFLTPSSTAKLFIANVVLPSLIKTVEERLASLGLFADRIEPAEEYRFRRRKSYYKAYEEGINFFGPKSDEELDKRLVKKKNSKHDFFGSHKVADYSNMAASLYEENTSPLKPTQPPLSDYLVTDLEAFRIFGVKIRPRTSDVNKPVAPAEPIGNPNENAWQATLRKLREWIARKTAFFKKVFAK